MSHQAQYRTAIKIEVPKTAMRGDRSNIENHPSLDILRSSVEKTASERGGVIADSINDNEGKRILCDFAIKTPYFERGIGIKINSNGEVSFIYDAYGGYEKIAREIEDEVTQHYTAIAVIYALKELDYEVEAAEDDGGQVLVKGVM